MANMSNKTKKALLILFAVLIALANAEVHKLDSSTYDKFIKSQPDGSLVLFAAQFCGHCRAFKPAYEAAAERLSGISKLASVDCGEDSAKEICKREKVKGYPTIKFISPDGTSEEYDEGRSADAVVNYILAKTTPEITYVKNEDELTTFINNPSSMKVVINTAEDSPLAKEIKNVAPALRKTASIAINTGTTDGKITLYRTFDTPKIVYTPSSSVTGKDLTTFVEHHSLPVLGELGPNNFKKYLARQLPLTWIFIDPEDAEQMKAIDAIRPIAAKFNDQILFGHLDGAKWKSHAKTFGLEKSTPGLVIEKTTEDGKKLRYIYPHPSIDIVEFEKWVGDFVLDKLSPTIRSDPIPTNNTNPVKVVVGKQYKDIVHDDTKDVLLTFKIPTCGHCKTLLPKLDELAQKYKDDDRVVIATFDANTNDFQENFVVSGYPTIYLFPAGNKGKPIEFDETRTVDALYEFIQKNRGSEVKKPRPDEL